jgi:hypothetical protein
MNLMNPIEIPLKHEAKCLGYWLRRIPETDPWYSSMGPYFLVNRKTGRVQHQHLGLHEVFGVLTGLKVPPSGHGRVPRKIMSYMNTNKTYDSDTKSKTNVL